MKPGFWTQGPVLLQALNLLESVNLRAMGHNSPEYLHLVVETVKLAFADRDRLLWRSEILRNSRSRSFFLRITRTIAES
jgi:gamma-glutamyltranspeptidase